MIALKRGRISSPSPRVPEPTDWMAWAGTAVHRGALAPPAAQARAAPVDQAMLRRHPWVREVRTALPCERVKGGLAQRWNQI
jgi:hypothetical protein